MSFISQNSNVGLLKYDMIMISYDTVRLTKLPFRPNCNCRLFVRLSPFKMSQTIFTYTESLRIIYMMPHPYLDGLDWVLVWGLDQMTANIQMKVPNLFSLMNMCSCLNSHWNMCSWAQMAWDRNKRLTESAVTYISAAYTPPKLVFLSQSLARMRCKILKKINLELFVAISCIRVHGD